MSRRKQSRPRHVDNDEATFGVDVNEAGPKDVDNHRDGVSDEREKNIFASVCKRSSSDYDSSDDEINNDEFCSSGEILSPDGSETISPCAKCGMFFTDHSQFTTHAKLCLNRNRILMPYDPPVNGYIQSGYDFCRGSLDDSLDKDFSDGEDNDFESVDDEDRLGSYYTDYSDGGRKRKRRDLDDGYEDSAQYRSRFSSNENFMDHVQNRMTHSLENARELREHVHERSTKKEITDDDEEEESGGRQEARQKTLKLSGDDPDVSDKRALKNCTDPAIAWAMKAAERGLFGGIADVALNPLAATGAAFGQCRDSIGTVGPVPVEVNMFRTMLVRLQQQQMMQIQMIQQMKRQMIASGVNQDLLPADIDLRLMSSESLASLGAAMSGLHNRRMGAAVVQETGLHTSSGESNEPSGPYSLRENSRNASPIRSDTSRKLQEQPSHPVSEQPSNKDPERLQDEEEDKSSEKALSDIDLSEKYLPHGKPLFESPYTNTYMSPTTLTKNPLEILQERTAASLSSLPISPGARPSSSTVDKPPGSSLLNFSALFASSPSLSALQKETDALKPLPIIHPLSMPMTAEDYKGYIQRGTILERAQYASDDPFFKHKCRFCHKVFGSDSALQIHVRSHTGERPFKCNICGNRFSTKGNLKVHFDRHKAKYPHIKMDAIPVPEHFDKHPHLMPSFVSTPISPSVPLPPQTPRLPIPSAAPGPPSSSSTITTHSPMSKPSSFPPLFGGSFLQSVGSGMSPFGLMPPPRGSSISLSHPFRVSLPPSMAMMLPPCRDIITRMEFQNNTSSSEISFRRSLSNDHENINKDTIAARSDANHNQKNHMEYNRFPHLELHKKHNSTMPDNCKSEENFNSLDGIKEKPKDNDNQPPESQIESSKINSASPTLQKSFETKSLTVNNSQPTPKTPLPSRSMCHSSIQSPVSAISWSSLASPQSVMLSRHHSSMFSPHHLPPGFPGLGFQLPGLSAPFPLPPSINPVLPMPGHGGQHPYLPPRPSPYPQQNTPPPEEGSVFGSSVPPTKTIDPSESLEQYMEVQKSETSKLEALVKNIEQKITDPNQCVICHRILSCKSALQMHYRIHTGERPFKCKICGRSFTTKGNLKTHMGVHRAKPALRMMHQCPVCHKQFTNVLVLQQHIRAHTGSMQHMPHMPVHPSYMELVHRPSFGLNRGNPYAPRLYQEQHSLGLSREAAFNARLYSRARSITIGNEPHRDLLSMKMHLERQSRESGEPIQTHKKDPYDEALNNGNMSRPHSTDSEHCVTLNTSRTNFDGVSSASVPFTNRHESTFLPPAFGDIPFDAPLAALEERVKAIDSQLSQTSFEKFRNSMGLDTTYLASSSSLSIGDKNTESGPGLANNPESPASGDDTTSYGHPVFGSFYENATTCNICLKTFECKNALDSHYKCHTKLNCFQCPICDDSFSTKDNLTKHLLIHKADDIQSTTVDGDGDGPDDEEISSRYSAEDDNINEQVDEDYPFEEDDSFVEGSLDLDVSEDEDLDDITDEFTQPPISERSFSSHKSLDDSLEDNNNITNFQNHNDGEHEVVGTIRSSEDGSSSEDSLKHVSSSAILESQQLMAMASTISDKAKTSMASGSEFHLTESYVSTSSKSCVSTSSKSFVTTPSKSFLSTSSKSLVSTSSKSCVSTSSISNSASPGPTRRQGEPKHLCRICMKPFSSASALQIHTRIHTGDKPFKCTMCSKAFTTRGNLKVHMGTHMWNSSPSRRGRRMSIESPFLLSRVKNNPFLLSRFHPQPSPDFFYQYPLSMMDGPGSTMPIFQNLSGGLPSLQSIPPHLMNSFILREGHQSNKDHATFPESPETRDSPDTKPSQEELDHSVKLASIREPSPSSSVSSTQSSLLSSPPATLTTSTTTSSTPSPSSNIVAVDLRNIQVAPWLWGAFPCHQCGHVLPSQDSLEHHFKVHHLVESPEHGLSKSDTRPPKALLV